MDLLIAHDGHLHWASTVAYLLPVLLLVAGLVFTQRRAGRSDAVAAGQSPREQDG